MKARYKENYKGRSKPPRSGHRGEWIFQSCENPNEQIIRHKPEHYNDANSPAQQPYRNRHKYVMHMWSLVKDYIKDCFEGPKSDYIKFLSYNLKQKDGRIMVSHGTLPSNSDFQPGDELRKIVTPDGQSAQVHLRPTPNGYLCSTEYLNCSKISLP